MSMRIFGLLSLCVTLVAMAEPLGRGDPKRIQRVSARAVNVNRP